jgi:hypothetical protein
MTMKTTRPTLINCIAATFAALMLTGCGGGSGGGGGDVGTGSLSLSVTDSPVLEDVDVCIHFTGITLHHSDGDQIQIPYDPGTYTDATECMDNLPSDNPLSENNAVNLSALQGELSVQLMDSERVRAGYYNWIRLDVKEMYSYVMDSGVRKDLSCPSCDGGQSGLKLNRGITVPAGGEADFMIDIDLAKSLNRRPNGDFKMRPTLRLVDLTETGHITGSVAGSLVLEMISETDTGCKVYVYAGNDILPDDYYDMDNVLTSAKVLYDSESMYTYVAAYLPTDSSSDPTPYTVALTCDDDDPEVNQNNVPPRLSEKDVIFTDGVSEGIGQNADVYTDQSTIVNFSPEILPEI